MSKSEPEAQQWMREAAQEYLMEQLGISARSEIERLAATFARHAPAAPSQTRQPDELNPERWVTVRELWSYHETGSLPRMRAESEPETRQPVEGPTLANLPRCPKCKSADISKLWAYTICHQCGEKFDWKPSAPQTRQSAEELRQAAEKVIVKRTTWLESFGVPISHEFAEFAEAIGELTKLAQAEAPSPNREDGK